MRRFHVFYGEHMNPRETMDKFETQVHGQIEKVELMKLAKEIVKNCQLCQLEDKIEVCNNIDITAITRRMVKNQEVVIKDDKGDALDQVTLQDIKDAQQKSQELRAIYDALKTGTLPKNQSEKRKMEHLIQKYTLRNESIYYKPGDEEANIGLRLLIPYVYREAILRLYHANPIQGGHLGEEKLLESVRHRFYWPGWTSDVAKYCKSCHECQSRKPNSSNYPLKEPLYPIKPSNRPWAQVHIDLIDGQNNEEYKQNKDNIIAFVKTSTDESSNEDHQSKMPVISAEDINIL
uniref:RNA-directed DNA polymerase n=1 Tax=Acrobeloides nanus TaxID=290746 RepID=A0A914EL24_9BILA